jgi:hypothetical protein
MGTCSINRETRGTRRTVAIDFCAIPGTMPHQGYSDCPIAPLAQTLPWVVAIAAIPSRKSRLDLSLSS